MKKAIVVQNDICAGRFDSIAVTVLSTTLPSVEKFLLSTSLTTICHELLLARALFILIN